MIVSLPSPLIALFAIAMRMTPHLRTHAFMTPSPPQPVLVGRKDRVVIPFFKKGSSHFPTFLNLSKVLTDEISSSVIESPKDQDMKPFIKNAYGIELTGGNEMNSDGFTGKGIKVAVIDSGIDETHSGFDGKVQVIDYFQDGGETKEYFKEALKSHGTHVAGTIHMMAPDAEILDYRAFELMTGTNDNSENASALGKYDAEKLVTAALTDAIEKKVDIINMSFGRKGDSTMYSKEINEAKEKGIVIVCAAGDGDGDVTTDELIFPASHSNTISVSSIGKGGAYGIQMKKGSTSVSNNQINFAGIGEEVLSYKPGNSTMKASGTSFAAAHVTGFIAALLGKKTTLPQQVVKVPTKAYRNLDEDISIIHDLKKSNEKKSVDTILQLLKDKFVIKLDYLGGERENGDGFLTYLKEKDLKDKTKGYITSLNENSCIHVVKAFFTKRYTYVKKGYTYVKNALRDKLFSDKIGVTAKPLGWENKESTGS